MLAILLLFLASCIKADDVYTGIHPLSPIIYSNLCFVSDGKTDQVLLGSCDKKLSLAIVSSKVGEIKDIKSRKCFKYDLKSEKLILSNSDCTIFLAEDNFLYALIGNAKYSFNVDSDNTFKFENLKGNSGTKLNNIFIIPIPKIIRKNYDNGKNELYIRFNNDFALEVNRKWKGLKAVVSGSNGKTIEKIMNFELYFDTSKISLNGYVKLNYYYPIELIPSSSLFLQLYDSLQSCPDPLVLEKKLCTNCPSLTYKNTVTGKCGLCDTSKNLLKLDNTCFQCEGNSYLNTDDDTCKKCAANQKADLVNKVCTNCPKGEVFDVSLNDCTKCASDRIATDKGCEQCTSGKVPFEGRICVECKSNQIIVNSTCVDCGNGMIPERKNNTCVLNKSCTVGKFWDKSKNKCVACGDGEISSDSKCVKCAAGEFADKVKNQCVKCSPGTESSNGVVCKPCKEGYYSKDGVSCKRCASGTNSNKEKTECVFCKPGYGYQNEICVKCPRDKYSNGKSACLTCPDDKKPNEDQTSCVWCPAGFEPSSGLCTKCQPGKYSTGSSVCISCPNKKIPNDKQTDCFCPPGTGINNTTKDCETCPADLVGLGDSLCEKCPSNSYPTPSKTNCLCNKNYAFIDKKCVKCIGSKVVSSSKDKCEKVDFTLPLYVFAITILSALLIPSLFLLFLFLLLKKKRESISADININVAEESSTLVVNDPQILVDI